MNDTMTDPPQIRLGIIGTGLAVERLHWPALKRLPDRFRVVAFADINRASAERFASYSGCSLDDYHADYRDVLRRDDVEAVLIALPIPLNEPIARASLEAGKHVFCEKPPGADLEQANAFLQLSGQFPDRTVLMGENWFYRDDLRLARSLLDAGVIGRVHLMTWRMVSQLVPRPGAFSSTPWRQQPAYRGGPHLDGGVHMIAQIRLLCGDVRRLHGVIQDANPTMGGPSDLALNLVFASGAIGDYVAAHPAIPLPAETNHMRLYGDEGVVTIGGRSRTVSVFRPDGSTEEYQVESPDLGYYNEFLNFSDAIAHGEPVVGTVAQSYHNMLVVMRALDSAEEGQVAEVAAPGGVSATGVPLWRPRGATGLFDGLQVTVRQEATARGEAAGERKRD
ncbi:MAG TPA: Gfo/Idh/MocA family oxidoreductase [Chloroflexota bacterium]|nr:Gfo/Idh/MocA family oxidoreductase [Chloroflexota bacterium]